MLLLIFLAAAIFCGLGLLLADKWQSMASPRLEGLAFVLSIVIVSAVGLYFVEVVSSWPLTDLTFVIPKGPANDLLFLESLRQGLLLLALGVGVYLLSAARVMFRAPFWISDVIVIVAAFLATRMDSNTLIKIFVSNQDGAPAFRLGPFDSILTLLWIWLVARLCASLNRVPAVAGGYIGLLALTICALIGVGMSRGNSFAPVVTAALAGAGLTAFVLGLRQPRINLGWSSILAMGFLLGKATSMAVLQNTLPAILAFAVLALGLPLLNVSVVKLRAQLRGHHVDWTNRRLRLDQALTARGVPPRKIALYYFAVGAWLCLLAYLSRRALFDSPIPLLLTLVYVFVLLALAGIGAIIFFSVARLQMRRQPEEEVPESIEAFGVKISPVSMTEALDKIEEFINARTPRQVLTSDANAILTSRKDPEYAQIMREAALITPDGFGVIWGARLLNLPIYERVTGVDMVTGICERAAKNGHKIYILGSDPGVAATAAQNLTIKYPGLQLAGTHHGFWRREGKEAGLSVQEADERMADAICRAAPDVLFVAMGIPSQEKFIAAQKQRMNVPVSLGVGGSFDVYSGKFNRAPENVQRLGLEWLYRVWIDPSRWKRMGYVPKFMLVALKTWLFGPREDKGEAF